MKAIRALLRISVGCMKNRGPLPSNASVPPARRYVAASIPSVLPSPPGTTSVPCSTTTSPPKPIPLRARTSGPEPLLTTVPRPCSGGSAIAPVPSTVSVVEPVRRVETAAANRSGHAASLRHVWESSSTSARAPPSACGSGAGGVRPVASRPPAPTSTSAASPAKKAKSGGPPAASRSSGTSRRPPTMPAAGSRPGVVTSTGGDGGASL